jgi:tripartite-type tricarboxylate transporter receptor subunit TctC
MKIVARWIAAAASLAAVLPAFSPANAAYPERPVRVIVGLAPGGGTDTIARIMTQKLTEVFNQSFVIDNRPSSGGNIAGELLARAQPDGYTLLVITPTHVVNGSLFTDIRYNVLRDFTGVVNMVYSQYALSVRTSVPATTVAEFIALAKSSPQKILYASSGIGTANHLSAELFKSMAGVDLTHVPYKGSAPAVSALLGGEVQVLFSSLGGLIPHVKAGRLRTLGVTGPKRTPSAPDIPTIAEAGVPGFEVSGWYGLAATAKTPAATIERLNAAVNKSLPELRERYAGIGADTAGGSAAEFNAYLKSETEKWARVVKLSGAKVE